MMSAVALVLMVLQGCRTEAAKDVPKSAATQPLTRVAPKKDVFIDMMGSTATVVYLCDASSSMKPQFQHEKKELKDSVEELDVVSGQSFNVIFMSDDMVLTLFKDGPHIATKESKQMAREFIDNQPCMGDLQPLPAIKFALSEKPDLLYVLTGGFGKVASPESVTEAFKQADAKTHVTCILLPTDQDAASEEMMKRIAANGRGEFKKYSPPEAKN